MISYKSKREIEKMRASGQVIVKVFDLVRDMVRPGVTTGEIDAKVEELIRGEGGIPFVQGLPRLPRVDLRVGQ